jgi:iron complex transport system substrate-binding protein
MTRAVHSSRRRRLALTALVACAIATTNDATAVTAVDDAGRSVVVDRPPARVVTLAPNLTELVFAAGGGASLVGVSALSDYPAEARAIARIGDAGRIDVERVLALKPDLVLVWQRGNVGREIEQLERAGVRLFQLEPQRLDDVARAIERLGVLLGHDGEARQRAGELRAALAQLRAVHASSPPVRVFYQVWQQPLMTVNRRQIIDDILGVCAGRNVFADLAPLVPTVSTEAVVAADPEVILTASEQTGAAAWKRDPDNAAFALWRRQPRMVALRRGWLYTLDGDLISRQGPRIVDGAAAVCAVLDEVRRERAAR